MNADPPGDKVSKPWSKSMKIAITLSVGFITCISFLVVKRMIYDNKIQDDTHSDDHKTHSNPTETIKSKHTKLQSEVKQEDIKEEDVKEEKTAVHVTRPFNDEKHNKEKVTEVKYEFISYTNILQLLTTNSSHCVLIDVRDPNIDFIGGHIAKSINISSTTFYLSLPSIITKYSKKSIFILMCMYGAHRSPECMEFYTKAINEIIKNYNKETSSSFYYLYTSKKTSEKHKIHIECDELMYHNLCKQKLYILHEGFFAFLNNSKRFKSNKNMIVDFDMNYWQELTILNEKKLYHKREFFASEAVQAPHATETKINK